MALPHRTSLLAFPVHSGSTEGKQRRIRARLHRATVRGGRFTSTRSRGTMKKQRLYVAVVIKAGKELSARAAGDWASFVGEDKANVIARAMQARDKWQEECRYDAPSPYQIY